MNEILVADTRKPYLENEQYHFSISHCGNFAAAIVSNSQRVGVDIELVTPRIHTISHKFLTDAEKTFLEDWELLSKVHLELTTILWSAKEAIYKWYSVGSLDFKAHMHLAGPITFDPNEWVKLPFIFKKNTEIELTVMARVFDPLVMAYVVT